MKAYLDAVTYLTAKAIVEYIKKTYSVIYPRKGVMDLLHRLVFVYKKPKLMRGSHDPLKQDHYHQYSDLDEGKRLWKQHSSYHLRSLVETAIMRFKQLFSDRLRSRTWVNQQAEVNVKCCILNKMIQIASAHSLAQSF